MSKPVSQPKPRPLKTFKPTHRLICTPDHVGCTAEEINGEMSMSYLGRKYQEALTTPVDPIFTSVPAEEITDA